MNVDTQNNVPLGLTSNQANENLVAFGYNEIGSSQLNTRLQQIIKIFSDPMGLMLLGLAILYFMIGENKDAVILLVAFIPVTAIDVFLELKSEKALETLRGHLQLTSKIYRDGVIVDLPTRLIVPDDVLVFEEGQTIPADGQIIDCQDLSVSEAALTGESIPVTKSKGDQFLTGTTILSGRGLGRITKTAKNTEFGRISHLLDKTVQEKSPLQKKVQSLVNKIIIVAIILIFTLFFIEVYRGHGIIQSLMIALTFGMSAFPEEFPIVFTLYLSLGAWRLSKHGVLVKSLPSVEALGNVDVICTDKTGTLTEGIFRLVHLQNFSQLSDDDIKLITLLACEPIPIDSMEKAIFEKLSTDVTSLSQWRLIHDYPFEIHGKHMTHVWCSQNSNYILAMKGSVEGVLYHSNNSKVEKEFILNAANKYASEGKRILGLATKTGSFTGHRKEDEAEVNFIGILVFTDPVRATAKKAIIECQNAGIEIKMLTGDHYLTAHAIAHELQIKHHDLNIHLGSDLELKSMQEKQNAYLNGSIFARVTPVQKYELVQTLKENGKVIAMTGDGINDSPALKLADIGVSMGENATDVARSTAKMILMKNDFNGIVEAVFEGRNILNNLRRSFSYLIAFHIPIVIISFVPPLVGLTQIFKPIHIIILELIVHPISAFAFENLKQTNHKKNISIIPLPIALTAGLSGVLLSLLSLLPMIVSDKIEYIRSLTLSIVLFGNIGLTIVDAWPFVFSKRVLYISVILFLIPFFACNSDFINQHLNLVELSIKDLLISLALGIAASVPTLMIRLRLKLN